MELKQHHHNYVALFTDGRLKIGRTSNIKKRMRYYRGVYHCIEGRAVSPLIARFVERNIREVFAGRTLPGTFEWFDGADKKTLCVFAEMTARMQDQLEAAL